jgi:hypothetical protein
MNSYVRIVIMQLADAQLLLHRTSLRLPLQNCQPTSMHGK